jgi:hypothetical protein
MHRDWHFAPLAGEKQRAAAGFASRHARTAQARPGQMGCLHVSRLPHACTSPLKENKILIYKWQFNKLRCFLPLAFPGNFPFHQEQ